MLNIRSPNAFSGVLATLAALIAAAGIVSARADELSRVRSTALLQLDGAWISRGYGILWHVKNRTVTSYEISGAYCIRGERSDGLPDSAASSMLLDRSKSVIQIGVSDGIGYRHIFDRKEDLPASCLTEPDQSPAGVFDALADIFAHRYAFFARRGLNWRDLVRSYRPRIKSDMSDAALFRVLSELLDHLGDEHVALRGEAGGSEKSFSASGKRIKAAPVSAPTEVFPGHWSPAAGLKLIGTTATSNDSGSITYGTIDGRIGYLNVKSLWWRRVSDLDETLDNAMDLFQSVDVVVVDLSHNGGGGEDIGKRLAERFASKRALGLLKYPGDSPGAKPQAIFVEPSPRRRFLGPTYVITSKETFSAAETTAMYMGVLGNVTHIGSRTAGALSDVLEFNLPNGWRVGLSNEVYLDTSGRSWEGIGIPPKIHVAVKTGGDDPSPEDIEAARRVLAAIERHSTRPLSQD